VATFPLTLLDVFTDVPLSGNGLAVVHDADSVDDDTMLRVARETRLSETTFVQSPTRPGADYRNRIWTMTHELPFAGHPSLGTAVAVARVRGDTEAAYTQETPAGLQPIEVALDGDVARASMLQEPASFGPEIDPGRALAAAGLSLTHGDPDLPPQIVSTGANQVIVPVREEAVARASPRAGVLWPLLDEFDCVVLYLVACGPGGRARARSFMRAPGGAGEDPATGSAVGPLCAYLELRTGARSVAVEQGIEMGRPSVLEAVLEGDRVRVSGAAVVVADGTLRL
jgi:trans-2,3-dihydro-3-hydroxyanthranilate isomerase